MTIIVIICSVSLAVSHYPHLSEIYWYDNKLISTVQLIKTAFIFNSHGLLINFTVNLYFYLILFCVSSICFQISNWLFSFVSFLLQQTHKMLFNTRNILWNSLRWRSTHNNDMVVVCASYTFLMTNKPDMIVSKIMIMTAKSKRKEKCGSRHMWDSAIETMTPKFQGKWHIDTHLYAPHV